ncbi:putative autophagy protein Apg16 [Aspergillus floccosus]
MAHWRDEFSAALAARDRREKANAALYDAYIQLADRTAQAQTVAPTQSSPLATPSPGNKKQPASAAGLSLQEALSATRADLSEAQRSRSELQEQLVRANAELEKLRKKNTQDQRRVRALESEITHLQMRLKDLEGELRGKAKLLDDFQDEIASLYLQLNMAEEKSNKYQRENQELVDRWMARMGEEAEAMNKASRFS